MPSISLSQLTASEHVYGCAVERHAEALAAQEKEVAQREASLQNEQEQVRQQKAVLEEAAATIEKERLEARDMLKVTPTLEVTQTYQVSLDHCVRKVLIRSNTAACIWTACCHHCTGSHQC